MWKQFIREYLGFTKKERIGIFILLTLILACLFAPFAFPWFIHDKGFDHLQLDREIAELKLLEIDSSSQKKHVLRNYDENNYTNYYEPAGKKFYAKSKAEVFYFDPNTASVTDWQRLGVTDKTAETIQKYVSRGGHFNKADDISKIWGLHKNDIDRLTPYVRIAETKTVSGHNEPSRFKNEQVPYKKADPLSVDINTSDSAGFISMPGIGNRLARRIIAFREKLGGFYSVDQVAETFGLPDSTFQKIKSWLTFSGAPVKKININTASLEELRSHPYIRYYMANAMIQYRTQHGSFSSVEDIKKIMTVTDDIYKKVSPYLTSVYAGTK